MINRAKFFNHVRGAVFHGHMTQKQVDGMNTILDAWESDKRMTDYRWLAYMLGTAYHETAATMQPIKEYGSTAYFTRNYDVMGRRPDVARRMGNTEPGDGPRYCGRGYDQLTWKINYLKGGQEIGLGTALVENPDLAMEPGIAARLMFEGMTRRDIEYEDHTASGKWTFTGRALEDYFNDTTEDWEGARRIINGTDHAAMIADTARDFYDAIEEA